MHQSKISPRFEEQLKEVRRDGNKLSAVLQNELTGKLTELSAGQVIFDYGTIPADGLYQELRKASVNGGVTDLGLLVAGEAQSGSSQTNPAGTYELHRIGDAVSSRNIHAAVLDALRLCQKA